jgi:hypothetical protein
VRGLLHSYTPLAAQRLRSCMADFLSQVDHQRTMVVGGVAINHYAPPAGGEQLPSKDLDVTVNELTAVSPGIREFFYIGHHHPEDTYLFLVHRRTGLKVDVFGNEAPYCTQSLWVPFAGQYIRLITAEDQLVRLVLESRWLLRGHPLNLKHVEQAQRLLGVANYRIANKAWLAATDATMSLREAFEEVEEYLAGHNVPAQPLKLKSRLRQTVFCPECRRSPRFPITRFRAYGRYLWPARG